MSTEEILQLRRRDIFQLTEKYGARNVRLFGSMARGDSHAESDVDFLVDMEPGRSLLDHVALRQGLEELLGRHVDLVTERSLHWYIRDRVLREAKPL